MLIVDYKRLQIKLRTDKEGHFILIKAITHQEEITIVNIYTPNI
jgi:hypothetical protein